MNLDKKVIITTAITGNAIKRDKCPSLPYTPEEFAAEAVRCARAGASIIHIHVRDDYGTPTMDVQRFRECHEAIDEALTAQGLDAIINLSTGAVGQPDDVRWKHIEELKPEICSFNPGTLNWGTTQHGFVYLNTFSLIEKLASVCSENNVKPEFEIFDTGMFGIVKQMIADGMISTPCHFQLIMGIQGGMDATIKNASFLLDLMPEGSTWSITGIGRSHVPMMLAGLAAGANGIRVGLEDNIWFSKGVPATNESLTKRASELVRVADREVATAAEARQILGVKDRHAL